MCYSIVLLALAFNGFDFLTGFVSAVKNRNVKSAKMRDGLFKKIGYIFCYVLAYMLDTYGVTLGLNITVKVLPIIVSYVVLTEIISIVENICQINSDLVPEKLRELLHI